MRTALRIALPALALISITGGRSFAEEVIDPYAVRVAPAAPPAAAPPATTTTTTTTVQTTPAPVAPPAPAAPTYPTPPPYYNEAPPPAYPPPGTFGYQQPAGQPAPGYGVPPSYNQGYYLYPQNGRAPVYYAPPPSYPWPQRPVIIPRRPVVAKKWDGVRRFSLGLHGTYLGLNQKFDGERLQMGGAGFQLRLRSKGRIGLEASQSFLKGQVWNGGFTRQSFPFTLAMMVYAMPNEDKRHFNLYGLAGVGASLDNIQLRNGPYGGPADQAFISWILQAGIGAELRFKWFAIEADARVLGLFRDNNIGDGQYYRGVNSTAPVAAKTLGVNANVFLSFWF